MSRRQGPTVADFRARVYRLAALIPVGRVTTYGRIAGALGNPSHARIVGWALRAVPDGLAVPCHRVVNRDGDLTGGWSFGHPDVMRALLEAEGVPFVDDYRVQLDDCVWDPEWDESAAADEMHDLDAVP